MLDVDLIRLRLKLWRARRLTRALERIEPKPGAILPPGTKRLLARVVRDAEEMAPVFRGRLIGRRE